MVFAHEKERKFRYQMVFDRFPGHNTPEGKEFTSHLEKLGVKVTFTHKATGKARLERWFGTLQTVFMQDSDYYYGEGIQSKRPYAHRSPEYLKKIRRDAHKAGFDLGKAVQEATRIVEAYRNTPYSYYSRKHRDVNKSPRQLHAESDKPNVYWIDEQTMSLLFGMKKEVSIRNNGLIVTEIYKTEYIYQVDDFDIIKKHPRIWISYDPEDLQQVYLFIRRDHLYAYIGRAKLFNRPQIYGPQAEFNKLAQAKKRNSDIDEKRRKALEEKVAAAGELDLLMGRFTVKSRKERAETALLQASGDDIHRMPPPEPPPENDDMDIVRMTINKY